MTASSNDHSPNLPATHSVSASKILSASRYEDVDLEPLGVNNNLVVRKHQYETVVNDDEEEYNSLLRSENWSHNQSLSTSLSRTSGSPSQNTTEKMIFDNPKYSSIPKRFNIYRSESSNSTFEQTRQQRLAKASQKSHADNHEQYYKGSSKSINRVEDESEIPVSPTAKLPVSPTGVPPSSQYTHVLPNTSEERDYAYPIVSTGDQYVSEHGHVYLMLEGATAPDKENEKKSPVQPTYSKVKSKRERADKKLLQIEADSSLGNSAIYHSLPDTEDSSVSESDYDVIGSEAPRATRHTSNSDDSGYDVIERGDIKPPPKSIGSGVQYDVMDRQRIPREQSSSPLSKSGDYDVIERTTTPSNIRSHKMTVLLKQPRPPAYSSLDLPKAGDRETKCTVNSNSPFYDALDLERSKGKQEACQCDTSQLFYHTVEPEEKKSIAEGIDNAIYHAIP